MDLGLEPYSVCLRLQLAEAQPPEQWRTLVEALLDELGRASVAAGARLIGHIKCAARLPGGGILSGSKVGVQIPAEVVIEDASAACFPELRLSLNVLVYGLSLPAIQQAALTSGRNFWRTRGSFEVERSACTEIVHHHRH